MTSTAELVVTSKSHGVFRVLLDAEDYERVALSGKWSVLACRDGRVYFQRRPRNQKCIYLHRFILNAPEGLQVDHIHNDYLDLRKSQLQTVTNQLNSQKQRLQSAEKTSRYRGVSWNSRLRKWRAQITVDGKHRPLGLFGVETDAAQAYDNTARELNSSGHGYALNFPQIGEYSV